MSLEHLLLWLSAKGQGSWSQFRGAVEEFCAEQYYGSPVVDDEGDRSVKAGSDLPVYHRVRFDLSRLGHVEFFSKKERQYWRVVPPSLTLFSRSPGEGLLCGARSPNLLKEMSSELDVIRLAAPGMPDRIMVRGSTEAVVRGASRVGLLIQLDAPTAMLLALPDARDPATWHPMAVPETPSWTVHRFSSSRLCWDETTGKDALIIRTGLFRFIMGHQRFYYLLWRGRAYRVSVQVGKYAVMRKRRGLLTYDTSSQTLSVPAVCRPPLLIERALVLCSGLLPSFDPRSRRLEYSNVYPEVASLTAQLLRQEIAR